MANFHAQVLQPDGRERRVHDDDTVMVGSGIVSNVGDISINPAAGVIHLGASVDVAGQLDMLGGAVVNVGSLEIDDLGSAGYVELAAGQTAAVSPAGRGRLRYNATTNKVQVSENGGAYTDVGAGGATIGGSVAGGTVGSVLFVGAGGLLAQDNANFFWDDTLNALLLGGDVTFSQAINHLISIATATTNVAGGQMTVRGAHGWPSDGSANGRAGALGQVRGGDGGAGAPGFAAGNGGAASFIAGSAGATNGGTAGTGGSANVFGGIGGGAGGVVNVIGGTAGTGFAGGNVRIEGGLSGGTGTGAILIGTGVANGGEIANVTISGTGKTTTIGGDAFVAGKLTVVGVIDPTQLLLTGADKKFGATDSGPIYLSPFTDVAGAVEIRRADGITSVLSVDTTSRRVGLNTSAPTTAFEIVNVFTGTAFQIIETLANTTAMVNLVRSVAGATGDVLHLDRQPGSSTAGHALSITMGSNASGDAIEILEGGAGTAIDITLTNTIARGIAVTDVTVGTTTLLSLARNATGATGVMLSLAKSPAASTGGSAVTLTMGSNTTGDGVDMVYSGTGNGVHITHSSSSASSTAHRVDISSFGIGVQVTSSGSAIGHFSQVAGSGAGFQINSLAAPTGQAILIIWSAAATGNMIRMTQSGSGNMFSLDDSNSGASATFDINKLAGSGAVFDIELGSTGNPRAISIVDAVTNLSSMVRLVRGNSTGAMLDLNKSPGSATGGNLIDIVTGANAIGHAINIAHSGTGNALSVVITTSTDSQALVVSEISAGTENLIAVTRSSGSTGNAFNASLPGTGFAYNADLTGTGARGLRVFDNVAGTENMVQVQRNVNGASGTMIFLQKIPTVATGGHIIDVVNSASMTDNVLNVTHVGIGDAVNITIANALGQALVVTETGTGTANLIDVTRASLTTGHAFRAVMPTVSTGDAFRAAISGSGAGFGFSHGGTGAAFGGLLNATTSKAIDVISGNAAGQTVTIANFQNTGTAPSGVVLRAAKTASASTGGNVVEINASLNTTANALDIDANGDGDGIQVRVGSTGSTLGQGMVVDDQSTNATTDLSVISGSSTRTGRVLAIQVASVTRAGYDSAGRAFSKFHTAFSGSESFTSTGAVQTTNATATQAFTFTLADNTLYWFDAFVIARETGGTDRAFYTRQVRVHRQGGGGATLGTINSAFTDETVGATTWDATFDVSSNDIRVTVTGAAATTINWTCTVRYQAVSGSA